MKLAETARYTTGAFRALEFGFSIEVPVSHLARYLDDAFSGCATAASVDHRYSIAERPDSFALRYELHFDGELVDAVATPSAALALLLWHVNRQVVSRSADRYLLVHASAAVLDGRALVFPAPMESGKTTLVAGLVAAGFEYVTDEATAIDPRSGTVVPYAKPMALDAGSWPALPGLAPDLSPELRRWVTRQWHVPADRVRPEAVAQPAPIGFVICPRYDPRGATRLDPVPRSTALAALIENSFNFRRHASAGLDALRSVVAASRCYRVAVRDLSDACSLIRDVVLATAPEETPSD